MTRNGPPAALMRDVVGRILNISLSGCLIESPRRLEVGTVGRLELTFGDDDCADYVVVVRCEVVDGTRPVYHVGARFLAMAPRAVGSIRHAVSQYVDDPDAARPGWVM